MALLPSSVVVLCLCLFVWLLPNYSFQNQVRHLPSGHLGCCPQAGLGARGPYGLFHVHAVITVLFLPQA